HRDAVATDLRDPRTAFQAFTFVAGTGVLASALAVHGRLRPAAVLLAVAAVSWLLMGYALPWAAVLGRAQRPLTAAANGTWFIWVVAAQSVAVLASTLEPGAGRAGHALRSEEHTSDSSHVSISYAVFCLNKKNLSMHDSLDW